MDKFISASKKLKLPKSLVLQRTKHSVTLSFFGGLGIFILAIAIIFAPLFGLYYLIRYAVNFFDRSVYGKKIDLKYAEIILASKFAYYQKLSPRKKTKFLRRLLNFIDNKEFRGCGNLELTDEMVILISASAIRLTFGLNEYGLDHFSRIFVYPKAFYSKISKQYHKGETNLAGAIALSWSHFTEGYNKPNDKVNLGLHEMAHALRFDKFKNEGYDQFFNTYYDKWQIVAKEEFQKTRDQSSSFFREYGGANFNEFFAVCVETFFESPAEFKKLHPEIYRHMSILLNQDPLNDFSINEDSNLRSADNPVDLSGQPFYVSGTNGKNLLSLLFATVVWLIIVITNINNGINIDSLIFALILLVLGYFITLRAFSKIYFYDNGIIIKSPVIDLRKQKNEFRYNEVICVEFVQREVDETSDTIKVIFLNEGKIRSRSFSDTFSPDEVLRFADLLHTKKVAVKLNQYYRYSKSRD